MTDLKERQSLLDAALELARIAEGEILPRFRHAAVELKADGTPVTEADRRAEAVMREQLARWYPTHRVSGEEFGASMTASPGLEWLLDPVDGTAWFTLGIPVFGTLIALLQDGEPILGVIHLPAMGETVYAATGLGCWNRVGDGAPRRVQVTPVATLAEAYASASGTHGSDLVRAQGGRSWPISRVVKQAGRFRFCADCLQHGWVAKGTLHVAMDTIMAPWDIAALVPCVEEAGGVTSTLSGTRTGVVYGGSLLSTSSRALQAEVVALLAGAPVS
jgi:histidinol-phosphatase